MKMVYYESSLILRNAQYWRQHDAGAQAAFFPAINCNYPPEAQLSRGGCGVWP